MKIFKQLIITTLFLNAGCTVGGFTTAIKPMDENTIKLINKANSLEGVTGGTKYEVSPSGYKVRHSVGALFSKQKTKTPNGYQVYSQIQGRISSEEDQP